MMNIIDTNDFNNSCCNDNMNLNAFADQPLSSVFDCSITNMNNNLDVGINNNSNSMNGGMGNNVSSFDTNQNRLLLKHIRNRNTKDFKDLVANFWNPSQNNTSFQQSRTTQNQGVKNAMPCTSVPRRTPSADEFGNFHPIDLSASKNKNNFNNGKPNTTMDMRIPLETPSCGAPTFTSRKIAINKNLFRPYVNSGRSSNLMDNTMMPPLTQSMNNSANSRRVSMCSSSTLISEDSNHSQNSFKPSASAIINAATNIVNGNDFDGNLFNPNTSMNNVMSNMNADSMPSNVVSEPGPYDIVCGRNSGAYNYIGNRRFRVTIEMNLQRYIDSPTREDKTNVIKSIVWMLHEQVGARFLKKETCKKTSCGGGRKRGTPRYTIMTDKQAREKVGHALRDLVITARKEQQHEKKQSKEHGPKISV
mmetsp:Transcript_20690/g.51357  ORF Transcript_20690/g.51357 Transcript_20690/m.51357 type:complete len:419 (+) Transcript_20690:72-1328(+)|eukprot:CAMPEP_0116095018 /NCGR_PEP_ID=MMETSP0327-20121206/9439_1 /TAXON_ID=44447 /ORGANISM="Pseudo-nitzschia delicatissima, Strain B596" /LENGTH=418 /DNA_ID=CAMNT_0003586657 /DNA_START=58 /DNA_END=1314 /DNA_ORIENTATION=-